MCSQEASAIIALHGSTARALAATAADLFNGDRDDARSWEAATVARPVDGMPHNQWAAQ